MNPIAKLFVAAHVWLYQVSSGKRGATIAKLPVILLTTRGRKSGTPRTVPVVPYVDGDKMYVMGSMGGSPKHPAWFLNLEANPDVQVQQGAQTWSAKAVVLPETERARVWPKVVALMPNFGDYEKKTTRLIPVVQLQRAN